MIKNKLACLIILVFMTCFSLTMFSSNAQAACICCCSPSCADPIESCSEDACSCQSNEETGDEQDSSTTMGHITREFYKHEMWLVKTVFQDHVLPAMMLMANQLSTIAMQQMLIVGTFFDAKHQLESQRLLQQLQAEAHKDYHPSTGMCRFGTNTRSLAHADGNVRLSHIGLATRNTERILMTDGAIGTGSALDDSRSRLAQFRNFYCNPKDFGNALDLLCTGGDPTEQNIGRRNKDVNYTNNVQDQDTLLINFTDTAATEEEEDVLALSANLYGNRLLPAIPEVHLADTTGKIVVDGADVYMETRALSAKRSVAFNSFAAQAAIKSEGGEAVAPYITQILEEMGVPAATINLMLKGRPSYHAQMELLTKKLYQYPNFYSDLYDKPVNVDRKDTAMQAIALMQKRDMYRSQLRSEANMAVWLETLVEDFQEYETNEALGLKEGNEILFDLGL